MNEIHCDGCGRLIGYSTREDYRIWCTDAMCRQQPPIGTNEVRDDAVFLLAKLGRSANDLATMLGVSRQRAAQIVSARS